jgi:hypothetical protein
MKRNDVEEVIRLAHLLIERANEALEKPTPSWYNPEDLALGKETSALRRTSMELTRSLSRMRNPS